MPKSFTRYVVRWEDEDDATNGEKIGKWFSKASEFQAKCNLCKTTFSVQTQGILAIKRHASQKKHKQKSAKEKAKESSSRESEPPTEVIEVEPSTS